MRLIFAIAAVASVPAAAQTAVTWPVSADAGACTATQPGTDAEDGRLSVTYDAGRREVVLTSLNRVASPLPASGTMNLRLVFRDNAGEAWDEGWGTRQVSYTRTGDAVRFTLRFVGEQNVRQLLADLAASRSIGLLDKREPVIAYYLAGLGPAVAELKACATRAAGGAA